LAVSAFNVRSLKADQKVKVGGIALVDVELAKEALLTSSH
jgi:hypothetical protein